MAKRWYQSLAKSGQATFYEPSDWGTAYVIAESMSRELQPQPVISKEGDIQWVLMPLKGSSLAVWLKATGALMATEGDRRRLRLELDRMGPSEEADDVSDLAEYRRRLHGSW